MMSLSLSMSWLDNLLDRLAACVPCGYHAAGPTSSEPTALAALALFANGRDEAALQAIAWLAHLQNADGSVGPTATQTTPGWPTSLAVLCAIAWKAAMTSERHRSLPSSAAPTFDTSRAVAWILQTRGEALPRASELGHDTSLVGWPWIEDTHSWIEPTAMHVLALKAAGQADHPRTREAVRLLVDRLLPDGGCNYGNTVVMGQVLRPHLQPTGLTMLTLAGEPDRDGRVKKSLDYLAAELSPRTAAASLSYGLLGLAAHGRMPASSTPWLEAAFRRTLDRDASPYRLALIALASLGAESPLISLPTLARSAGEGTIPRTQPHASASR
jgi:hypothetical protein